MNAHDWGDLADDGAAAALLAIARVASAQAGVNAKRQHRHLASTEGL